MRRSRKTSPAHILLPAAIAKSIPRLGETSNQSDPILHVKWFTPDANFTWYVARFCPDQRIAYGFVIGHDSEWGTFSLDEIEQLRGRLGLPVERDLHFDPIPASQLPQF